MAQTIEQRRAVTEACRRRLHDERVEWGVCILCGKPLRGEKTLSCAACIEKRAEYREKNRERIRQQQRDRIQFYKANGLCIHCGRPAEDGYKKCAYHREYYKQQWHKNHGKKVREND